MDFDLDGASIALIALGVLALLVLFAGAMAHVAAPTLLRIYLRVGGRARG